MAGEMVQYGKLLAAVKVRIRQAQTWAALLANHEMLVLYWDIGRMIVERQEAEAWGAGLLRKLAQDLKNEIPTIKGFSERNLKRMTQFYREYPALSEIRPPLVAQKAAPGDPLENLQRLVIQLSWAHNIESVPAVVKT